MEEMPALFLEWHGVEMMMAMLKKKKKLLWLGEARVRKAMGTRRRKIT